MAVSRGKHVSIPKGTTRAVRWLEQQPDVARLIFGQYKARQKAKTDMHVVGPCRGGLQLLARGEDLAMEVFVHTADPDALASRIGDRFGRN